ncbi:hypothetical protein RIF29_38876 [Crotalaria pallida]|uniref:Endonuclease/exonuclease/phosphatase n=1 Tax=Crotalaria pallida TaxID=3830 RepID=A0AAN9E355_CROPI
MNEVNTARNCLDQAELKEVDFCGYRFTWSNKRKFPHTVEERLAKALSNQRWHEIWHYLLVSSHARRHRSDHNPILVEANVKSIEDKKERKRRYRFEQMWLQDDECESIVQQACVQGNSVHSNIDAVGKCLMEQSRKSSKT